MLNKILISLLATIFFNTAFALDAAQQNEMVTAHNKWRQEVDLPEIKWSGSLAVSAQDWADNLKETQDCNIMHSTSEYGENIYRAEAVKGSVGKTEAQAISPTQVTSEWYSEKKDYTYDTNTCATGKACGHYTQIVWRATNEIGCGNVVCPDSSQIWVCYYTPAGNTSGIKPY